MFTITFANPKGGSGKTTSAMILAEQILSAGARVAILDCDPNQNIVQWGRARSQNGNIIPFNIVPVPEEEAILDTIDQLRTKADYLIIDLEGTASQSMTYAISQSDLVLIPFEPTPMEARQAARAGQLVRNIGRMTNRNIPHALLLTRANAAFQTSEEKDVRREIESSGVTILKNSLVRRAPYTRIFRDGSLLGELRDGAIEEVKNGTKSQQDRLLKPLLSASENAAEYTQEVMDILAQLEVV